MQVIPKKTFLLRQEQTEGQPKKDVIAHRGVKIEVSQKEALMFWGNFDLPEDDQKKLMTFARANKLTNVRVV